MAVRSFALWLAIFGSLTALAPACARTGKPAPESPLEPVIEPPPPAPSEVYSVIAVDREFASPGESVALSAELTPDQNGTYDVRMWIAAPDGSRVEAAHWESNALEARATSKLTAQYAVAADAREGIYGVSLAVVAPDGTTRETGNIASFRVSQTAPEAAPIGDGRGVTIKGRHLVDGRGRPFIPRGPEIVTAGLEQTREIDAIAATGANALRMLLTLDAKNQMTPQAFDTLIGRAVEKRMVVWISLFTWDNEAERAIAPALGGGHLRQMSDYLIVWQRQWLKDLIKKYDGWVIVDAMQEFKSTIQPPEDPRAVREWVDAAKHHVRFFRRQGFTQPLEIMTSFEGRDLHAIIANAEEILEADTLTRNGTKQTLFGWQAYWGPGFYEDWQGGALTGRPITASEAVKKFVATRNYPIMVGLDSVDVPGTESYEKIMPACAAHSVGWLWWEWDELKSKAHGKVVRTSKLGFAGAVRVAR